MDTLVSVDPESKNSGSAAKNNRTSWITFPFIIGTVAGVTLANGGYLANLIVYLIQEFNFKSIDAAQVFNVVNGASNLFPIVGAILADSFFGNFSVITLSTCVSFLGLTLLFLTSLIHSLRPAACGTGSSSCQSQSPSSFQHAILYGSLVLTSAGFGGTRYTLATMGANQFDRAEDQNTYFNWFFFTLYSASVVSATAIVYAENFNWPLGFGICLASNFIALAIFLLGSRFYRHFKPQGSPYTGLARVIVATIRKRNLQLSSRNDDYYYEEDYASTNEVAASLTSSFKFFNRAAIKTEGDIKPDGSIAKPWRICTTQQVEDIKVLIRIFPVWTSSILLATPLTMQLSLTVLQALSMDRHLGKHFQIPASSIPVLVLIATAACLTVMDRFVYPFWRMIIRKRPTPFQKIGVGHVLNVVSMAASALVESRRLKIAHAGGSTGSMLVVWIFPQLIIAGIGEAFQFPGQVALYYQEFPVSMRSTATAMISVIVGIAFYLSTALTDLITRVTGWLPNDINDGRLDNVYWALAVLGVVNFLYFLVCAKLYRYHNVENAAQDSSSTS